MKNAIWNSIEEFNDINTKDEYHMARAAGLTDEEAREACGRMSRDNARTPVQWNEKENAGFTTGTPWLKVNSNYKEINVAGQERDADSVLNYYRRLVHVRKYPEYKDVFTYGKFVPAYENTDSIMAYYRENEDQRILVAANFGKEPAELELSDPVKRVILSNRNQTEITGLMFRLESCQVVVLECVS